jgi:hypothetical protein
MFTNNFLCNTTAQNISKACECYHLLRAPASAMKTPARIDMVILLYLVYDARGTKAAEGKNTINDERMPVNLISHLSHLM